MLQRFRTAFLRENLVLLVLSTLKDHDRTEWEILDGLHSRYGFTPTVRDFRRTVNLLMNGGFATAEPSQNGGAMTITEGGLRLLQRLEAEYRDILLRANPWPDSVLTG